MQTNILVDKIDNAFIEFPDLTFLIQSTKEKAEEYIG